VAILTKISNVSKWPIRGQETFYLEQQCSVNSSWGECYSQFWDFGSVKKVWETPLWNVVGVKGALEEASLTGYVTVALRADEAEL